MWDLFGAAFVTNRDCIKSLFPKEIKGLFKRNKTVPGSSDLVFQLLASPYHYFQLFRGSKTLGKE